METNDSAPEEGENQQAVDAWLDRFFAQYYAARPVNATFIGGHEHDHRLPDVSAAGLARNVAEMGVLRAELAKIRSAGMALTVADVQPFTGSMSAPIRSAGGKVVASLCFIFRKVLLRNEKRREELQDQLMHMAHSISIDLGWRPDQG